MKISPFKNVLEHAVLLAAIIKLIFMDQYSKIFMMKYLKKFPGMTTELLPHLNLVYVWNYGISFGFFNHYHYIANFIFIIVNFIILAGLIYLMVRNKKIIWITAYSLIISGGISNLIDRIVHGAVFDFISIHYQHYYFPAFNIADCLISLGAILLFLAYLSYDSSELIKIKNESK